MTTAGQGVADRNDQRAGPLAIVHDLVARRADDPCGRSSRGGSNGRDVATAGESADLRSEHDAPSDRRFRDVSGRRRRELVEADSRRIGQLHLGNLVATLTHASRAAVLRIGRAARRQRVLPGGEYSDAGSETTASEIYNPVLNLWTEISPPPGWTEIGDAPCCVL